MYIKLANFFTFLSFNAKNYFKKCVIIIQESIVKIVLVKKMHLIANIYTIFTFAVSPES